jgi:protein-tyrosine phosphatase
MNVLFVCNGNICRSPIAEAMLKKKYAENNIEAVVSSAGFESFNINEPPDSRAQEMARKNNLSLDSSSRLFLKSDFDVFHKIYVMDTRNYRDVMDLARNDQDRAKIDYLLNVLEPGKNKVITDPFLRSERDLKTVYKLIDRATDEIVILAKSN